MKNTILLILTTIFIFLISCSSGGKRNIPTVPPAAPVTSGAGISNHILGGIYQVVIDTRTGDIDYAPLRNAGFHLNMVLFLQDPNPWGFIPAILNLDDLDQGRIDVAITLIHPLPYVEYTVFDVKGIIMGDGNIVSEYNPSIVYADINGPRIINADGWTRWWNKSEFTGPMIFGYNDGVWGTKNYPFSATLNPFKAYGDHLTGTEEFNVPEDGSRNRVSSGAILDREYKMQFPLDGGTPQIIFNYAIDCSWEEPADKYDPESFPPEANQPEAYLITVEDNGSDAYYHPGSGIGGGDLHLSVGVYDHGGTDNPDGTLGELDSLVFESQVLFDDPYVMTAGQLVSSLVYSDGNLSMFDVLIADTTPTGLENQDLLVHAITNDATYDQGMGLIGPSGNVAAYGMFNAPITEGLPPPDDITGLTIEINRDSNYQLTGFSLDWDESFGAEEYVVYWYTDPYEVDGDWGESREVASNGVVSVSEWTHVISGDEANGQWIFEVVARAYAGSDDAISNPSENIFVDFAGFENYADEVGNRWKSRYTDGPLYNHFVIGAILTNGCGGSGSLFITPFAPINSFARNSLAYFVTPRLPQLDATDTCTIEFAHKRTEDFPLVFESGIYDNEYVFGYSIGSIASIYNEWQQVAVLPWGSPYFGIYDYDFDLVHPVNDYVEGSQMNGTDNYIEGLDKRFNSSDESSDPADGWTGLASDGGNFELTTFSVPKVHDENHNFAGLCWGGKEYGVGLTNRTTSAPYTESWLVCDEIAVVVY